MQARLCTLAVCTVLGAACGACAAPSTTPPAAKRTPGPAGPGATEAAAANSPENTAAARCRPAPDAAHGSLSWFHDDYGAALACAKKLDLPLVIDMWAPWCHTCLSMKQTVLADPGLAPVAERFVWLMVDTDKDTNAAVTAAFPPAAWPTFFVISPGDEKIQARFVGGASMDQFRTLLREGEQAYLAGRAGTLPENSPLRLVRGAHRAEARGALAEAAALYGRALTAAPANWSRRPDVLVSRIGLLYRTGENKACLALAAANVEHTGRSASAADFTYYAVSCAAELKNPAGTRAVLNRLFLRLDQVAHDKTAPLSVDDRSDALRILREISETLGDEGRAKDLAHEQLTLLLSAIDGSPTPMAAMTYNWPVAEVAVHLGDAATTNQVTERLSKSVDALPQQYDPPYRLAWLLHQTGQHDAALEHAMRALKLVYGARKARVQSMIAAIHRARGDHAAELRARRAVVNIYRALPESSRAANAANLERAEAALSKAQSIR